MNSGQRNRNSKNANSFQGFGLQKYAIRCRPHNVINPTCASMRIFGSKIKTLLIGIAQFILLKLS